ncbi:hypothetical protein EBBID32_6450 [Sphingobium indicum BiD32]|uniref:Uncharacterized protein n=1 Tax=Sphingobium indicum BiD32 TaxID=1301087 RepID=N1ML28_9SPHN|nr:hypothetical protein [Sphingobium indicum]CCW16312.1 hypothetical protein EBBID32_6450 [Sphingobium indicum BiD32]
MTSDVRAALDRFENFIGRFSQSGIIDATSGFTTGDAALLIGEIELSEANRRMKEHYPHDDT